jgi:hypothetical protein
MITWNEIQEWLCGRWPISRRRDSGVSISVDVNGVRRRIRVEHVAGARPAAAVLAEVCSGRFFDDLEALRYNLTSEHGAMGRLDTGYVLRQVLPLGTLTLAALDDAIRSNAVEAARMAMMVMGRAPSIEVQRAVFSYLAD